MEKAIQNLKKTFILGREQVLQLKNYIDQKYSTESANRKAAIFANSVHMIVDRSVNNFEEKHRLEIRKEVVKSAVAKEIFEISGYDIFEVCSLLPIEESEPEKDKLFDNLTEWVNKNQEEHISVEEIKELSTQIINRAVNEYIELLEESMLSEPEIKDMVLSDIRNHNSEENKSETDEIKIEFNEDEDFLDDMDIVMTEEEVYDPDGFDFIYQLSKEDQERITVSDSVKFIKPQDIEKALLETVVLEAKENESSTLTDEKSEPEEKSEHELNVSQKTGKAEIEKGRGRPSRTTVKHTQRHRTETEPEVKTSTKKAKQSNQIPMSARIVMIIIATLAAVGLILVLIIGAYNATKHYSSEEEEVTKQYLCQVENQVVDDRTDIDLWKTVGIDI